MFGRFFQKHGTKMGHRDVHENHLVREWVIGYDAPCRPLFAALEWMAALIAMRDSSCQSFIKELGLEAEDLPRF